MSEFVLSVNSTKFNLEIINENELNFGNQKIDYELIELNSNNFLLKLGNKLYELTAEKFNGDLFKVNVGGYDFEITVRTALQEKAYKLLESTAVHHSQHTEVKAPMPGLILKIKKNRGETVELGESVIILEAMKMENDLKSPASGVIDKIFIAEGSPVEKGTALFSII